MEHVKIIFLTGHSKFKNELLEKEKELSLQGHIVLNMNIYNYLNENDLTGEQFKNLIVIHKGKIKLSEEVFVFNKGGILGEIDEFVIEHAKKYNKIINYLEPIIEEGDKE